MYKRVELIEEENLDWSQSYLSRLEEICEEKKNVIFVPMCKSVKTLLQSVNELDIQNRLMKFFDKNMALASSIGILLLPYFVGFLLAYTVFYNYGGMTIIGFLSIEKDHLLL